MKTVSAEVSATVSASVKDRVFVPFYEDLPEEMVGLGDLVPYQLEYRCLRLKDGTYEFQPVEKAA